MARERAFVISLLLVIRVWISAVFPVQAMHSPDAFEVVHGFLLWNYFRTTMP